MTPPPRSISWAAPPTPASNRATSPFPKPGPRPSKTTSRRSGASRPTACSSRRACLPGTPSDSESSAGRLENQRVEILVEPEAARSRIAGRLVAERRHRNEVFVNLDLFPLPDIAAWELVIQGEDRPLKTVKGTGDVPPAFQIPLDELGRDRLARLERHRSRHPGDRRQGPGPRGRIGPLSHPHLRQGTDAGHRLSALRGGRPRAGHRHRRRGHHRGQRTPAQLCLLRHRPRRDPEPLCPLQQLGGTPDIRRAGAEGHPGKAPPGAQHHRPAHRGPPPGAAAHHRLQLQLGRGKGQDRALTPPGRGRAGLPAGGLGDRACPHGRGRARPARGRQRQQHPRGPGREPARRDHLRRSGDSRHRPEHLHRSRERHRPVPDHAADRNRPRPERLAHRDAAATASPWTP